MPGRPGSQRASGEGRLGGEGPSGLRGTLTAGSARWWGRSESWRDGPREKGAGARRGGHARPRSTACLSGDWAGGEAQVWPQTGAESLLYAAPSLVTEHRPPPRARAAVGGEGGPPAARQGRLRWAWAVHARGQRLPPASMPLGPPAVPSRAQPSPLQPVVLPGRGPGAGPRALATPSPSAASPHTCSPCLSPRTCLTCPGKARGLSRAECPGEGKAGGAAGGRNAGCGAESA